MEMSITKYNACSHESVRFSHSREDDGGIRMLEARASSSLADPYTSYVGDLRFPVSLICEDVNAQVMQFPASPFK